MRRFASLCSKGSPLALAILVGTSGLAGTRSLALADTAPTAAADARRAQPVVKGKTFAITVGDVEDYIAQQPSVVRERFRDVAERKTLVENLARLALMSAEAERRGFDKALAVRHTVNDGAIQALIRLEIDEKVTPQAVTDAELSAYYDSHQADFHHPAERRASYIKLATREEAEKLLPSVMSADLRRFGELAKEQSIDAETKLRGGDLGYFVKDTGDAGAGLGSIDAGLRNTVFALKTIGDTVATPVPVDGGFAIVRYTGERPERHADLATSSSGIRNRLWREKRTAAVSALIETVRGREKPKVFADRVDLVKFDDMDPSQAGFAPEGPAAPKAPHAGTPVKPTE